jgi:hypothetical protein
MTASPEAKQPQHSRNFFIETPDGKRRNRNETSASFARYEKCKNVLLFPVGFLIIPS